MQDAASRTKLWYLKNLDIFSRLRDEDRHLIEESAVMRPVSKGEPLYLQGSADKNVYILKRGLVKLTKLTPGGKEIILDILKPGSLFGEMVGMDPLRQDESAEMLEDGLICIIPRSRFLQLLNTIPGLALRITKVVGFRLWKIENRLMDLVYSTVEQRLAKTIVQLLEDFGVPHEGGYVLKIHLTHKDFADLIASTRETVTATLNRFVKDGLLSKSGKYWVVNDLERLKEICW